MLALISLFAFYKLGRRKLPCHGSVSTGHPVLPWPQGLQRSHAHTESQGTRACMRRTCARNLQAAPRGSCKMQRVRLGTERQGRGLKEPGHVRARRTHWQRINTRSHGGLQRRGANTWRGRPTTETNKTNGDEASGPRSPCVLHPTRLKPRLMLESGETRHSTAANSS